MIIPKSSHVAANVTISFFFGWVVFHCAYIYHFGDQSGVQVATWASDLPLWWTIHPEVPTAPSLGLINLPEWLTELRETFYSLDRQWVIEAFNSGTARGKRGTGQGMWEGVQTFHYSPRAPLSLNPHVFTNPESLQTQSFWVLWWLHYMGMIDSITGHWWLNSISSPFPLPSLEFKDGPESSKPLLAWLAQLVINPQKSPR